jgi:hypothetical protein
MSKPVRLIPFRTTQGYEGIAQAVIDSGSFYSLIRRDLLPRSLRLSRRNLPAALRAATKRSRLRIAGSVDLVLTIEGKRILDMVLVSRDLGRDMIVGAHAMQAWDISIRNRNGHTKIVVGHEMREREITEVD